MDRRYTSSSTHYQRHRTHNKQPQPPIRRNRARHIPSKQKLPTWQVNHVNPPQIANLILTPTSDPTPYDLIQAVTSHLDTTNASDHKYLKQLAEQAHYLPDMTLEQYISTHEQIRTIMIAARYPEISDPKTTVEFLIDGLRFNPSTATIGSHLIALDPKDTKDFVHKFNRLTMYRQPTQLRPSHMHGDTGGSNSIKNSAPAPYWCNRTPPRNLPVPKNPCRFHMSLGVSRPRHTDLECNHTAHPRHRARPQSRSKPHNTARTAHGHFDYTGDIGMAMDDTASEAPSTTTVRTSSTRVHTPPISRTYRPYTSMVGRPATKQKQPLTRSCNALTHRADED